MKRVDRDFSVADFQHGARAAYEMIVMAYENGDLDTLRAHLSPEVFEPFAAAIEARKAKGYSVEASFAGVREVKLVEAHFDPASNEGDITMRFVGELTSVVRDPRGPDRRGRAGRAQAAEGRLDLHPRHVLGQPQLAPDRHRRLSAPRPRAPCPAGAAASRRRTAQLWEAVAATATPLHPPAAAAARRARAAAGRRAAAGPAAPSAPAGARRPSRRASRSTSPPTRRRRFDRAHPHMDRRRFEKLRRGRLDPEAGIDLHGMTSEHAHAALTGFIVDAHADGLRLVLVITGKGRPDERRDAAAPPRHPPPQPAALAGRAAAPRPHPAGRPRPPAPRRRRRLLRLPPPPADLNGNSGAVSSVRVREAGGN